jgi:SAM-dependent methyltransferase
MSAEWFTDYSRRFGLKPDCTGQEEAEFIRRALRLRAGHAVMDAPCGAGRVVVHLAKSGCRVTGIDLMADYVERARERFRTERLSGEFLQLDLRAIDFRGQFDAILNWQGSFGFFSDKENADVVRRFARALKAGGRLLIDQPNREHVLRHFHARRCESGVESTTVWQPAKARARTTYRERRTGKPWWMSVRLYTPRQMAALYERAGLRVEALYGAADGSPYRRGSKRLIVVGTKG